MIHARSDYDRIQDPAVEDPSLLSPGSTAIGKDEPVFILRAKDAAAPATLYAWAAKAEELGVSKSMVLAVRGWAHKMAEWQDQNGLKPADVDGNLLRTHLADA